MKNFKRMTATLLVAVMVCLMMPTFAAVSTTKTSDVSVTGWNFTNSYADTGMYIDTSDGDRAVMLYFNGQYETWSPGQSRNGQLTQTIATAVKGGQTYCFEFDAKAKNVSGMNFQFNWNKRISMTPSLKSYDWTKFRISYTPSVDENVVLRFIVEEQTDGFWIDNAKFYAVDEPDVNMITNGDFEAGKGTPMPENIGSSDEIVEAVPAAKEKTTMFANRMTATIDGKDDEWGDAEVVPVALQGKILDLEGGLSGGEARMGYDDQYLYFYLKAFDETHWAIPTSKYWENDGIQFDTATMDNPDGSRVERGAFLYDDGSGVYQDNKDYKVAIVREGNITAYEVAYPWSVNFGGAVPTSLLFDIAINNNDGEGRDYAYEITEGIVLGGKNANKYNPLILWTSMGDVSYGIVSTNRIDIGESGTVEINLLNENAVNKDVDIIIPELDYKRTVTVEAGKRSQIKVPVIATGEGDIKATVTLASGGKETTVTKKIKVNVVRNAESWPTVREKFVGYMDELQTLVAKCQSKKLSVDYERAGQALIGMFIEWSDREVGYGDYSRIYEYERELKAVYEECRDNMKAYLKGEKKPQHISKYLTGEIKIDGTSVIGKTETNGVIEEKPVFLTGYCTWETGPKALHKFASTGVSALQTESFVSMTDILGPIRGGGWVMGGRNDNGISEVVVSTSTEEATSGKYSMKVVNKGKPIHNVFRTMGQKFAAKPNTTYEYGLKAKGKGMTQQAKANDIASAFFNLNGIYGGIRNGIVNSDEWVEYNFEYTTNAGQNALEFLFVFQDLIDELYIDDVYVREKGTDENLIFNSDFEFYPKEDEMSAVEKEAETYGWYVNYHNYYNVIQKLKEAEQYNIAVDLLTMPHYMPDMIRYADMSVAEAGRTEQFLDFPLDNETLRTAIGYFCRLVAQLSLESKAPVSICMTNEPKLFSSQGHYYIPHWQKYIKELYGNDISKLNKTYGSDYKSFEEVLMPSGIVASPVYTDYRNFNDSMLAEFHQFMAGEIKKVNPDILCHSKIMQYFRGNYGSYYSQGTNYELQAHIQDVNGIDGWAAPGGNKLTEKMAWNDMLTSIKDAPVWNTEDHNCGDGIPPTYPEIEPYQSSADTWNGFVHGMGLSAMWLWEERENVMPWKSTVSAATGQSNAIFKPLRMWETIKTTFDINRLSREVTAVQKAERNVGLLYSRISTAYNTDYVNKTSAAYEDAIFSGQKVGFVTDSTPQDISKYDLFIVADAPNVQRDMLENIKKYLQNGGKVLIIGENCLMRDEYNKPHDRALIDYIYSKSDTKSSVMDKIYSMGLSDVVLVNAETGEKIDNVEWAYAEYNGKIVVNVLNYDYSNTIPVKILYKDKEVSSFTEMRSAEKFDGVYQLEPYKPVLIQFEGYMMGVNGMTLDDGLLEAGTVMVDDAVYDTEFNSSELLGRHIKFFYRKNSEDRKTILWMGETGISDVEEVEIDQSAAFDSLSYKLTYYDASNRKRTLDINRGAIVVYNGDVVNGNYNNFFTKPRYKMTLIENDKADDVVIIKCYTNYVVDAIDAEASVIYDAHAVNDKLVLDSNDYEYMSIKMLGVNEIDFSEISPGSVLSVYLSENKEYLEVFVSNSKENGNVSKIVNGFHGKIITINNIEYFVPDTVDTDDLVPGIHCSVYTDTFGDVAYIETVNQNYFAAYLMGAALDGVFTQQMKIKMLRQNNKIEVLDCADKFIVDGVPYESGGDVNNLYINGTLKPQLAMIELNSDGKIKNIDTAYRNELSEPVNSLTPNVTEVYANYKTAGVIGSKSVINNATVLFVVPTDTGLAAAKDEDYYIANKADLKNDTKLTYESYKTKERVGYEEFVVIKGVPAADNTDKPVLVSNIGTVMNDEGEIVSCIYGYCGNEQQTFCAADETVSFEGVVPGSLIRIYKDHKGNVENHEMIFDYNKLELVSANIIDTDEINTINAAYAVTYGYVNDVVDGVVSISKDKGGETGRVMYTNGIPVLVYDSSKRDGYNISIGNINDARTYQATKNDCSMIIMTGVRTLPNMFVIYN